MEETQDPVNQRIKLLIDTFAAGTQRQFAIKIGVHPTTVSEMFGKRQNKASVGMLQKIVDAYPQVRSEWLLTGEGEMLKSANADAQVQKTSPYTPHGEVLALGTLADQPHVDLPFPDFKALAHFGQNPGLSLQSFATSPTLRLYLAPEELPEKYVGAIVVEIFGDSMEPDLHSGERMVVWHVPDGKWEQLHNTVCVVSYDDTVTIKAIAENDLYEHNRLKLRAANPPTSYFVVGRDKINSIWEVREYYDRPKFTPGFIRR
jgi:phage repressor protein C with HTH and peptisase S24 domain